ncbi:hypothetical protein D3C72_1281500 [compost metagenome]
MMMSPCCSLRSGSSGSGWSKRSIRSMYTPWRTSRPTVSTISATVMLFMPLAVNTRLRDCITTPMPSASATSSPICAAVGTMASRRPTSSTRSSACSTRSCLTSSGLPPRCTFSTVTRSSPPISICDTVLPAAPVTRKIRPTRRGRAPRWPGPYCGRPPLSWASIFLASVFRSDFMKRGRIFTHTMIAPSEPNT